MRIVLLLNSVYYYCRKVVEDPVRPSGGVGMGKYLRVTLTLALTGEKKKRMDGPGGLGRPSASLCQIKREEY